MKRFRKVTCSLFLVVLTGFAVQAQVTLEEFLGSAINDHELKTYDEQLSYLQRKPYRLSPVREVQVRTQNREMLTTQQEYGLRVSPSNPWEVRANNRYFRDYESSIRLEQEIAFKNALTDRYLTAVEYIYYRGLLGTNTQGAESLKQQLTILEQQAGSRYFDADEFAELKVDELNYVVQHEEYAFEMLNQAHLVEQYYPKAHSLQIEWSFDNIITVENIQKVVDSLTNQSIRSTLVAYQQQQIILAQSRYNLEKSNINLGFFQASYDRRRVNQDRNPYVISLGVTIPITNPNKGDMARRQLDVIDAQYDLNETTQEAETDKVILQDKLHSLVTRYNGLKKRMDDLEKSNYAQTLSEMKGGDPLMFVQFNQRIRKLDTLLLKIRRSILITYIEYLAFTDQLQQKPLVNFLSPVLAPMGNR